MKRLEGGYLGGRPTWSLASNPGIWGIEQVFARRVAGTWPIGVGSLDEYYEYVTFMLHANGANASTSFLDSSLYGRAVTVTGNAQVSTAQSKFGGASVYFDGTGDYLTLDGNSNLALGTGDFTIEFWLYRLSSADCQPIDYRPSSTNGAYPSILVSSVDIHYYVNTASVIQAGHGMSLNQWHHIAVTKSAGTTRVFVDGVQKGSSYADSNTYLVGASRPVIAANGFNTTVNNLNGYIDELRITKGYARYTSNFSVPTGPYEDEGAPLADPFYNNVSLLLPMNGSNNSTTFTDKSPNALTVTANGDAKLSTAVKRYGTASAAFDGTGDYLTAPSSTVFDLGTDYTIEFWVYPAITPNYNFGLVHRGLYSIATSNWTGLAFSIRCLGDGGAGNLRFYFYATTNANEQVINTTGSLSAGKWTHIAMTRAGTTGYAFIDGVLVGTVTSLNTPAASSQTLRIGRWDYNAANEDFNGYIDDLRITKGVARYLANFIPPPPHADYGTLADPYLGASTLWMPMEGPVNSTGFFDRAKRLPVTTYGNAKISNAQYKWGLTSAAFDGTGDGLTVPYSTGFDFGSGDFTVEFWVYLTSLPATAKGLVTFGWNNPNGYSAWLFYYDQILGQFSFYSSSNGSTWDIASQIKILGSPSANRWYHIAGTRSGNTFRFFADGAQTSSFTSASALYGSTSQTLGIGSDATGINNSLPGYIDDLRIIKGQALYTASFTPPTAPINADTSSDPYLSNVSLLLKMDGANNSTTFTDSSLTPKTVFANGDAKISTAQSKFGGSSALFDGSGDGLVIPTSSDFDFGTGDFTIELWVNATILNGVAKCIATKGWVSGGFGAWMVYITTANDIVFYSSSNNTSWDVASSVTIVSAPQINRWYHIAVTRSGTTFRTFADGVQTNTFTSSASLLVNSGHNIGIGADRTGTATGYAGYIDDLRITKGVARYTANFIPPTISHPVWSETDASFSSVSLLLNGNGANASTVVADRSSNGLTLVPNGNAQISTAQSRFGGSSLYFDGTGDYLSAGQFSAFDFGTGDFTIEAWTYLAANNIAYPYVFSVVHASGSVAIRYGDSGFGYKLQVQVTGTTVSTVWSCAVTQATYQNQWVHIAYSRAAGTNRLFVNGILQSLNSGANPSTYPVTSFNDATSVASVSEVTAGVNFNGYIDDIRVTKGVARYTANFTPPIAPHPIPVIDPYLGAVSLLLHMNGANASTYFPDHSYNALAVTAFGNAQISTAQSKFGGASALFDGSGDYLRIPDGPGFQLSGVNFTVEAWIYPVSLASYAGIISKDKYGANFSWAIGIASTYLQTVSNNSGTSNLTSSYAFTTNTWYHIALVKNGTTVSHYVNGTLIGSSSLNISEATSDYITIGCLSWNNPAYFFNGYIEDVRVTKGIARYTSNFTPPTTQFPNS